MTLTAKDYYYHQLNKEQKKVYYAVKEGRSQNGGVISGA